MRILMINLPFAGHTNPTLPLTKALVQRGHRVTCLNAESFRSSMESTGAAFVPFRDFPADINEDEKVGKCFSAAFETAMGLQENFDLLIYEMFFYPGIDVAKRKHIPCVRQFSQAAWSPQTWKEAGTVFRLSARKIDRMVLPRKTARKMGLTYHCLRDGVIESRPDLNIVYVPEEFQGRKETLPGRYTFFVPEPAGVPGTMRLPYDRMKPPVVYISLGSLISNRGFCKECIRAFGDRELSVILNTGKVPPESLGALPDHIYAYSFVPQVEVLSHADAFLTHGGMNSINEAIWQGVPMVCMPFVNDQIPNARRVVELGMGVRVRSFPSSGRELYHAVCRVCEAPSYRRRVEEMRDKIRSRWDPETIVREVEALSLAE